MWNQSQKSRRWVVVWLLLLAGVVGSVVEDKPAISGSANTNKARATRVLEAGGDVLSLCFSPDERLLASGRRDGTVTLWNLQTGKMERKLRGHTDRVDSIAFSSDGKTMACGSGDATVKIWNVQTGKLRVTLTGHKGVTRMLRYSIALSPDAQMLATGGGRALQEYNQVKLWDADTGVLMKTLKGHKSDITSVAFSRDGKTLASGDQAGALRTWDVLTGRLRRTIKVEQGSVDSVAFSPDGRWLVSGSWSATDNRGRVRLWNARTGKLKLMWSERSNGVGSVAFSPDSKIFAGVSNKKVKLWYVRTGKLRQTLPGHDGLIFAFAPGGKYLATGYRRTGSLIELWRVG